MSTAQTPLPGLGIVWERCPTACAAGYFLLPLPGRESVLVAYVRIWVLLVVSYSSPAIA